MNVFNGPGCVKSKQPSIQILSSDVGTGQPATVPDQVEAISSIVRKIDEIDGSSEAAVRSLSLYSDIRTGAKEY